MDIDAYDGNGASDYAVLAQFNSIATTGDIKANVSIFGIKEEEFIMPEVTEGKAFEKEGEVIADDSLKEDGFEIGDKLSLSSLDTTLTITGFTDNAKFNAAPVLYTDLETVQQLRFGEGVEELDYQINGYVLRTDSLEAVTVDKDLQVIATQDLIESLPGYSRTESDIDFYDLFLIYHISSHSGDFPLCIDN